MKNTKKIVAIVLAVVLVFVLNVSAFATDTVNVTIRVANANYSSYTTIGTYQPTISNGDTVADVVHAILPGNASYWRTIYPLDPAYSPLYNPCDPLYDPDGQLANDPNYFYYADILRTVTLNNISYGTVDHDPILDEDDYYECGLDPVLDYYNAMFLNDYGGLDMYLGYGMYTTVDDPSVLIYIGYGWIYTVNGVMPGIMLDPPSSYYGNYYQLFMNEVLASSGDQITLTYSHYAYVIES